MGLAAGELFVFKYKYIHGFEQLTVAELPVYGSVGLQDL